MPKKVKESNIPIAAVLALLIAAGGGGYALAPDGTSVEVPADCSITISDETISCQEAIDQVRAQAQANADTEMMLDRNRQGIVCLDRGGEYFPEFSGCIVDGERWDWNGDAYQLLRTL